MSPDPTNTRIEVQQRDSQPVLSVRTTVPVAQLNAAQGEALRALWDHLRQQDLRPVGAPYVRYHTFGDSETDVEVGVPVPKAAVGADQVAAGELPGGTLVSVWHLGSHDRLHDAYVALEAWLKEHGREPAGAAWEVYDWIDLSTEPDPAVWPDPSTWRTQLVQPIR